MLCSGLLILCANALVSFGAFVKFTEIHTETRNHTSIIKTTEDESTLISNTSAHWKNEDNAEYNNKDDTIDTIESMEWDDMEYNDEDDTIDTIESTEWDDNVKVFINPYKKKKFSRKLVIYKNERVYVCSNNCIYQLSPALDLEDKTCAEWGKNDSHQQLMEKVDACVVLAMDYENERLIACGGPDGFCIAYNANNISEIQYQGAERLVGKKQNNTVAFVGSYSKPNSSVLQSALFVGLLDNIDQAKDHKMMQLHKVTIRDLQRDSYLMDHKSFNLSSHQVSMNTTNFIPFFYGFSYEGTGYFVRNDRNGAASLTKIGPPNEMHLWNSHSMICVDPISRITFTSARAAFIHDQREEKDALYVALMDNRTSKWAICMYSMNEINRRVVHSTAFEQVQTLNTVEGEFIFSARSDIPVSFTVTSIDSHTSIVLISTSEGYVIKIIIRKHCTDPTVLYDIASPKTIYYTASNVYCMTLDYSKIYLYILSANALIKIRITDCEQYKTEHDCLSLKDPYCGWCLSSSQCCLNTECRQENNNIAWISPDIEDYIISPELPAKKLSRAMQHNIIMNLKNNSVSFDNSTITCLFMYKTNFILNTKTTARKNIINCTTPSPHLIPIMHDENRNEFLSARLLVILHTFPKLFQTNILVEFFDCSVYTTCTWCSNKLCYWNVDKGRCTHEKHVNNDNFIIRNENSQLCPQFYPIRNEFFVYIPAEENKYIVQVDRENVIIQVRLSAPKMFRFKRLICSLQLNNHNITVNATISHETVIDDMLWCIITCKVSNLTYKSKAITNNIEHTFYLTAYDIITPTNKIEFSINYDQGTLENTRNMNINLYKCADMGDSCETCVNNPSDTKCGWCEDTFNPFGNCLHESACAPENWSKSCENHAFTFTLNPRPREGGKRPRKYGKLTFTPNAGPWEGGTLVNINHELDQSLNRITVAGAECQLLHSSWPTSKKDFTPRYNQWTSKAALEISYDKCKIFRNSSMLPNNSGPVVLHFFQNKVESTSNFQFVDPKIIEFSPKVGPKCGGTEVNITGKYMNVGSQIRVFFDNLECVILMARLHHLSCITSPSISSAKSKVIVEFDGNNRTVEKLYFQYVDNMESDDAIRKVPRGTPAGGIDILIPVTNFKLLNHKIIMMVTVNNEQEVKDFASRCRVINSTLIICPSPVFENIKWLNLLHENKPLLLDYAFALKTGNKLHDLQPLHIPTRYRKFLLYPDSVKTLLLGIKKTSEKGIGLVEIIVLITITATGMAIFGGIVIPIQNRKKSRDMQRRINKMGMEAIAMAQCIKKVIVEKEIELDEDDCRVLKLPNIAIAPTSVPRTTNDKGEEMEYELPQDEIWEFPRTNLGLGKSLGQGEFGIVVKGKAIGILEESIVTTVAIKMLKSTHTDNDMICLVSEMEIMKLIARPGHENVLRLLGCCTQDGQLLVITEYATHGNLLDYLRKHELAITNQIVPGQLNEKTLILFAVQVAKGMEYLASMRCIHRDLAARNILVSDKNVMKIADFGLARDVRGKYYYQQKSNARVPVRWMAPEAIDRGLNTTKSDVWSYGILLHEMVTLGSVPYSSYVEVDKLLRAIKLGHRMEKPQHCSIETYEVMYRCWNYQPEDRPTFTDIVVLLEEMLEKDEDSEPEEITLE